MSSEIRINTFLFGFCYAFSVEDNAIIRACYHKTQTKGRSTKGNNSDCKGECDVNKIESDLLVPNVDHSQDHPSKINLRRPTYSFTS